MSVTDDTITLEQANALEGLVAELPPIGDSAENLSGKTGLGDQALQANALDADTAYNFEGHDNLTVTVDQTLELNGNADLAGATVEVVSGRTLTLTLTAEQVTLMSEAGGSVVGDGKVEVTAQQATGREITGAGEATIELRNDGQYDFTGVDTDNASSIEISGEVTLEAGTDLGEVAVEFAADAEVSVDAATAHRAEINASDATLTVTGNQRGLRLDSVTQDGDTTIDVSGFEGTLARLPGGSSTVLATGIDGILIMRSDQATGKEITGGGTLELVDLDGQVDLAGVGINATVSSNQTLAQVVTYLVHPKTSKWLVNWVTRT